MLFRSILDDTLTGGRGNDRLEGGRGDDVYVWNLGDGDDVVSDGMGTNVLQLGAGIAPGDVGTSVEGSALVFSLPGGARIVVEGGLEDERNCFAEVRFEDGTVWTMDDVRNRTEPVVVEGTDEDDTPLSGTHMRDILIGRKGDDVLDGGKGDDVYEWNLGDGNDTIDDVHGKSTLRFGVGISRENLKVVPVRVEEGSSRSGIRPRAANIIPQLPDRKSVV